MAQVFNKDIQHLQTAYNLALGEVLNACGDYYVIRASDVFWG